MRIIAFITDACAVREILSHLGEPTSPPPIAPARRPPLWEITDAAQGEFVPPAQPAPDYAGVRIRSAHRLVKDARRRSDPIGLVRDRLHHGSRGGLVGHRGDPGPSWPSWCCGSGEVFRLRPHAFPESRLLSGAYQSLEHWRKWRWISYPFTACAQPLMQRRASRPDGVPCDVPVPVRRDCSCRVAGSRRSAEHAERIAAFRGKGERRRNGRQFLRPRCRPPQSAAHRRQSACSTT
jgi:hypothetical protein